MVGPLVGNDLVFAEHLARFGIDVSIFRQATSGTNTNFGGSNFSRFDDTSVQTFDGARDLLKKVRQLDFVFTFTGTFPAAFRFYLPLYPVLRALGWPAYMNICTGSDILELAMEKSPRGFIQRLGMRLAFVNMILNYPVGLKNAARLRLRNACILPFPYLPARVNNDSKRSQESRKHLVIFHPSRMDWGATDNHPSRASMKGNDRFIRAAARFAKETDKPFRLILVDHGSDRELARKMVAESGLAPHVEWRGQLSRDELYRTIEESDVIADQFDLGGLGGVAWEAMSLGKPVMMHLALPNDLLSYDKETPIIQAKSEDDILQALHKASDREWLDEQSKRVVDWMEPRNPTRFIPRYLLYVSLATGKDPCGFWLNERQPLSDGL